MEKGRNIWRSGTKENLGIQTCKREREKGLKKHVDV